MRSHSFIQRELIKAREYIKEYPTYAELIVDLNKQLEFSDLEIFEAFYKIFNKYFEPNPQNSPFGFTDLKLDFEGFKVRTIMIDCLLNICNTVVFFCTEVTQNIGNPNPPPFKNQVRIHHTDMSKQLTLIDHLVKNNSSINVLWLSINKLMKYRPYKDIHIPDITILMPKLENACKGNQLVLVEQILKSNFFNQCFASYKATGRNSYYYYWMSFLIPLLDNYLEEKPSDIQIEMQKLVLSKLNFYKFSEINSIKNQLNKKMLQFDSDSPEEKAIRLKHISCKFDTFKNILPSKFILDCFKTMPSEIKKVIATSCKDVIAGHLINKQIPTQNMFFFFAINHLPLHEEIKFEIKNTSVHSLLSGTQ